MSSARTKEISSTLYLLIFIRMQKYTDSHQIQNSADLLSPLLIWRVFKCRGYIPNYKQSITMIEISQPFLCYIWDHLSQKYLILKIHSLSWNANYVNCHVNAHNTFEKSLISPQKLTSSHKNPFHKDYIIPDEHIKIPLVSPSETLA